MNPLVVDLAVAAVADSVRPFVELFQRSLDLHHQLGHVLAQREVLFPLVGLRGDVGRVVLVIVHDLPN